MCMYHIAFHASAGYQSTFSGCGELIAVHPTALIQLKFPYALLISDYVNRATTTGGTVSAATNFAQLQVTTAATASAIMSSRYRLNYQPGQGSSCLFTAIFNAGVANNTQLIGMGNFNTNSSPNFSNIQDGFFFGYSGTTFGIFQYTNSSSTFTPQSSWSVDPVNGTGPSGMNLITTNGNVYKIQYEWLGFGTINFYVEKPAASKLILVHTIPFANTNTNTSLLNPSLMLMAGVANSATTASAVTLKTPCMVGVIEGSVNAAVQTRNSFSAGSTTNLTSSANFVNVLSLNNKAQFNAVTNQVMVTIDRLSVFNTSTNPAIISLVFNPTFTATPTFTSVSANSVVATNTTGTLSTTLGGKTVLTLYVASNTSSGGKNQIIDLTPYAITMVPGDILTVAGQSLTGTGGVYVGVSWTEIF